MKIDGFGVANSNEGADDGNGGGAVLTACGGGGRFDGIDACTWAVAPNGFAFDCRAVAESTGCGLLVGVDVTTAAFDGNGCRDGSLRFADGLKMLVCGATGGT